MTFRSGIGIDVHPLVEKRDLVLGGITIPFEMGLSGHSDGDVLSHAIIDALLGGAGLGDIGSHFPPTDPQYEDISSTKLLRITIDLLGRSRWQVRYLDATILAERPLLKPFMDQIKSNLSGCIGVGPDLINLKSTTTDGLGFVGRGEGIAGLAIATVELIV